MLIKWLAFVRQVACAPGMVTGVRKVAFDQTFTLTWEELISATLTYEDLGYTRMKGRQLERIYWPQEGMDAMLEKLAERESKPHTSVAVSMAAGIKDSRSQGFCMQSTVFTQTKAGLEISILYRSTEIIQKFLADLVFFKQKFGPLLIGKKPLKVKFYFVNAYISAVFSPIILRYDPDPLKLFQELEIRDPKFFRTFGLASQRNFNPTCVYQYRTRVKQWEYYQEHVGNSNPKMLPIIARLSRLRGTLEDSDEDDI